MKMEEKENSCMKVMLFSIFLLVSITFVFSGAVTALCISGYTGTTAVALPSTVDDNINDLISYFNNTLEEINFVMGDQLSFTLDQVRDDLNDIGGQVGEPVREALRTEVGPALDAVIALEGNINDTVVALDAIDTRQGSMEMNWETLNDTLSTILDDLEALCGTCGCCTSTTASLRTITIEADYRDINITEMVGSFPQQVVTYSANELTEILARNLSTQAQAGAQTFEDIPDTLTNTTASDVADIIVTIDTLEGTLNQFINQTTSSFSSLPDTLTPFQSSAVNFLQGYSDNYDQYRAIVMYVFYGFILFIVVLFLLGLVLGVCGYSSSAHPSERSSVSNCGGVFLMAASGLVFIFGTLIMLITALTFVIGGPIDRLVCDPLLSGELFTQTIDGYGTIVDDGYYLSNLIFDDKDIPLQFTGILSACENNDGAFSAFQLSNLVNISAFTDIDSQIPDVNSQFANLTGDFSNINILTNDTLQILIDFRDSSVQTINWTYFITELEKNLTVDGDSNGNSFQVLIDALDSDAGAASAADAESLGWISGNLTDLQNDYLNVLLSDAITIQTEIDALTNYTDTISVSVNNTINDANAAQDYIDNEIEGEVTTTVLTYSDKVLGYPSQFVNYATYQLENNIGGCQPVYNLWNSATNTVCVGLLRSFNGLWFTMGWCVLFLVISLIFGVKLARHFRVMQSDRYPGNDEYEMQGAHGNKVAPSYDA